jgi:hypothetical protein
MYYFNKMTETQDRFKNLKIGRAWTELDALQLENLYKNKKLTLAQIAEELGRDKNKLISELIKLNLVKNEESVRGINEYKDSEYYKLVQDFYKQQKEKKNEKIKETKMTIKKITNNGMFEKKDYIDLNEKINVMIKSLDRNEAHNEYLIKLNNDNKVEIKYLKMFSDLIKNILPYFLNNIKIQENDKQEINKLLKTYEKDLNDNLNSLNK